MKIFCSGIGGIGLSAYAAYQHASGHSVSGSDQTESALTHDLRSQGIDVTCVQDGNAVSPDADLFVYTLALPEDHLERKRATQFGIKQQTYFEALGELTKDHQLIAVCGAHGKSSTTAMAAKMLIDAGKDPSVILGTKMKELGDRNWRKGNGEIFLVEACEYRRSFLHLSPKIILMTNADGDHFDYFQSLSDYHSAFIEFLTRMPNEGILITHLKDMDCAKIVSLSDRRVRVVNADTQSQSDLVVGVPGRHMRENALLVLAFGEVLGIDRHVVLLSLSTFKGTWRRMEVKGRTKEGAIVIDDYAHHPREISETTEGIREAYPESRLLIVFQPHTHDRTLKLWKDFVGSFRGTDYICITDVYEARKERDQEEADVRKLALEIQKNCDGTCIASGSLENTVNVLQKQGLKEGDVILCMGAGDVWKVPESLLS